MAGSTRVTAFSPNVARPELDGVFYTFGPDWFRPGHAIIESQQARVAVRKDSLGHDKPRRLNYSWVYSNPRHTVSLANVQHKITFCTSSGGTFCRYCLFRLFGNELACAYGERRVACNGSYLLQEFFRLYLYAALALAGRDR